MSFNNLSLYSQWLKFQKQCLQKLVLDIKNKSEDEISILYFEYYLRVLPLIKYQVFFSKEVLENSLFNKFENIINKIVKIAKQGNSLKLYLSRVINYITKPDKMLNDHLNMRNANINSPIELNNGTVYMILGGELTMLGFNQEATMLKIKYMKFFRDSEQNLINQYNIKKEQLILKINRYCSFVYLDIPYLNENQKKIPLNNLILLDCI